MAEIDLNGIFKKAFGYNPPNQSIKLEQSSGRKEMSDKGQPFYATDLSGREFFLPVTIDGILIPFAVIGMTWKKLYVSTAMPERGGSVKELISIDDYMFNLKGIVISNDNNFPESDINKLHELFKKNASISMRSVLSDLVLTGKSDKKDDPDAHRVIIKEIKWPATAGNEHAKPFEMDLESDLILDLELNEKGFIGPQQ